MLLLLKEIIKFWYYIELHREGKEDHWENNNKNTYQQTSSNKQPDEAHQ